MKLELNDIRMDSESGIQIGEARKASLDIETLEQGPQTHTIVAAGFVGLTALGSGALVLLGGPIWLGVALVLGAQIGAGVWLYSQRNSHVDRIINEAKTTALEAAKARLEAYLDQDRTVSEICRDLGRNEVHALWVITSLLEANEIEEDVDLETGHFVYRKPVTLAIEADHISAAERYRTQQARVTQETL